MKAVLSLGLLIFFIIAYGDGGRIKQGRIVGGEKVPLSQYQFAARLMILTQEQKFLRTRCGVTIIKLTWAITAAHCLDRFTRLFMDQGRAVIRGNTSLTNEHGINHQISYYFIHEQYQELISSDYDIALIEVKQTFNGAAEKPIAIAPTGYEYKQSTTALIFGWGYKNKRVTKRSKRLRATTIALMAHNECHARYKDLTGFNGNGANVETMGNVVCAMAAKKGPCDEDNGGPMIQNNLLIGIISVRIECASAYFPTIFTKVSAYNDWINKVVKESREIKRKSLHNK